LDFIIQKDSRIKHCIVLDFNTDTHRLDIDLYKDSTDGLSHETFAEILSLPNEKAARPQINVTTQNISYLISQTLPNLIKMLPDSELKRVIETTVDIFFMSSGVSNNFRYSKILDPKFIKEMDDISCPNCPPKDLIVEFSKAIEKFIENKYAVKTKECIYTLRINGMLIAQNPDYLAFIKEKILTSAFEETMNNPCSICGEYKSVTQNTTRFLLKFYMTDKINFASYFDEKHYYKAVAFCPQCYETYIIGEKWIASNLQSKLGGFSFYLLPQFLWSGQEKKGIVDTLKNLPADFNEIKKLNTVGQKRSEIEFRFKKIPFMLNFLFFKRSQSSFKILTLIKDVPPYRLLQIFKANNEINEFCKAIHLPESIRFDLDRIYWLIPIRKKGADHMEYRKILQIYYNLFSAIPLQKNQLFKLYIALAHMHRFESYSLYQIGRQQNPEWALMSDTLRWNLFFLLLDKLDLIGGNHMDSTVSALVPEPLQPVFKELGYTPAQQGLALLGYVLEAAAYAQYKEGLKNKPVLGKLNYQGMTHEKVIRLFNELFEKINQYRKRIGYAERWLAAAQQLYQTQNPQNMTAAERVFYILSGYSFHLLEVKRETVEIEKGAEA
jgi:CRISPR-associated protein Csh1